MKRILTCIVLALFLSPIAGSLVLAADEKTQIGIIAVGNKKCPVMGEPVSGKDFVVYQGKRYNLCCSACEHVFLNNPDKYISEMKDQETLPVSDASKEMERDMAQGSL